MIKNVPAPVRLPAVSLKREFIQSNKCLLKLFFRVGNQHGVIYGLVSDKDSSGKAVRERWHLASAFARAHQR